LRIDLAASHGPALVMSTSRYARIALRTGLGFAAAGASMLVLLGQAGRYRHSLDQLNALLPLLLILLAVLMAIALLMRDRGTTLIAAIGLVVAGAQLGAAAFEAHGPSSASNAEATATIKVVTLSAFHSNPKPAGIRAVIAAEAPDLALLQETNGAAKKVVDTLLPGYHRLRSCKKPHCTLTILSRWPLQDVKVNYRKTEAQPDLILAEVTAPFGRFRVMNLHLPRPLDNHAIEFTRILARTARENADMPLIMAGDFNTATGSFGLAWLGDKSGLHRRDGFIPTYPANRIIPAFAGIDHVFADDRWAGADCRRTASGNSDHYGIGCRLRLTSKD
jgi:endonuclease/exonuclease/phosphatase (EEP) superfamily protein YafD